MLACMLMIFPPFQRCVPSHPQGYWLAELVGQTFLSVTELLEIKASYTSSKKATASSPAVSVH